MSAPSVIVDTYNAWQTARGKANTIEEDDELDTFCATVLSPLEQVVAATPATTLQELAIKVRMFEGAQVNPIRAELDALVHGEALP